MCLSELMQRLQDEGVDVTESQLRWAWRSGRLAKPPLDGSGRYRFSEQHVEQIRELFSEPNGNEHN